MTTTSTKETVNLAPATWIGLATLTLAIVSTIGGAAWTIQGRMTTVEARIESHEQRLNDGDNRDKELRAEILGEIRLLRQDIKEAK
jgi:hypothetical protein